MSFSIFVLLNSAFEYQKIGFNPIILVDFITNYFPDHSILVRVDNTI